MKAPKTECVLFIPLHSAAEAEERAVGATFQAKLRLNFCEFHDSSIGQSTFYFGLSVK